MSGRRVAALAAVIIVPVALLATVLASLLDEDGSGERPATTATQPSDRPPQEGTGEPSREAGSEETQGAETPDEPLPVLDVGSAPRELSGKLGPASSDGTIALGELEGTPIVLNVWSADCVPCRAEARVLQSEWERHGRRGVLFLGLNVLDSPAVARRFRAEYDVTYPSVEQKRGTTARSLGATGVPETFFISRKGKVVGRVVGSVTLGQIELGIRAAQTGEATATDEGGGQIPLP